MSSLIFLYSPFAYIKMILFVSLPKLSCFFLVLHNSQSLTQIRIRYSLFMWYMYLYCLHYISEDLNHYSDEKGTRINADRVLKNVIDV